MLTEQAGWRKLRTRRESPHHLQVRVSGIRDARSQTAPFRWAVDAEVCRVFRGRNAESEHSERRFQCGEAISFDVDFCVQRDAPLIERPIGPITVCLEDLDAARFLEVFLDRDLHAPAGQIEPIEGPTDSPRMSPDDPILMEFAEKWEQHKRRTSDLINEVNRLGEIVSQVIEEHEFDAFKPSDVSVFSCGDTQVVRTMLPHGHPSDIGSLRRFIKKERSLGRVSQTDERIACTRHLVVREVTHRGGASVFLA